MELFKLAIRPTEVLHLFIYLGFYVAFNTVQVISQRVVGRAEETSIYSWSRYCTVNCRPTASNYQLSHLRPCWEPNPGLRLGRRKCYHSATVAPRGPFHEKSQTEPDSRLSQGLKSKTFVSAEFLVQMDFTKGGSAETSLKLWSQLLISFHIFSGLIFSLKRYIS